MKKILVIIPAYNEGKNILKTVKDLKKSKIDLDYVVINDGSIDDTLKVLIDNEINYINLPTNMGIGCAVQTGYIYAEKRGYDIAVQFDGDGQHNACYIKTLIDKIADGNDLVIGSRYIEKQGFQSSCLRRLGIKWISFVTKILIGKSSTDATSGFRACNKKVISFFAKNYPMDFPESETYLIAYLNHFKIADVPVVMNERTSGKSSIHSLKSIYFMIKVTISLIFARIMWGGKNNE